MLVRIEIKELSREKITKSRCNFISISLAQTVSDSSSRHRRGVINKLGGVEEEQGKREEMHVHEATRETRHTDMQQSMTFSRILQTSSSGCGWLNWRLIICTHVHIHRDSTE